MRWGFYVRSVPFTRPVLEGTASLGGSESACLGLMRALSRRGHRVTGFVYDLAEDCHGWTDADGVTWEPSVACRRDYWHHTWDVFVSLRMLDPLGGDGIPARYRILWNQDLLQDIGQTVPHTVASCWGVDRIAYVSAYHRTQWEGLAGDLAPLGWVTRNGYDPAHVPAAGTVTKHPHRIIHVSRPERGLGPLLAMWPALKKAIPDAELRLCRYQSMYDGEGTEVRQTCLQYDAVVEQWNDRIGGITWLGSLGKADLYREIAEAAVMWYPGIAEFAETSCIAAIEAQACGTPLVLSAKGALPETAPHALFIEGNAREEAYQRESVAAVVRVLEGAKANSTWYRDLVRDGLAHVTPGYTYDAIAAQWEADITEALVGRAMAQPVAVLESLLAVDDHVAAQAWIAETGLDVPEATARIDRVLAGEDQTAEDYADHALADPAAEADTEPRFRIATEVLAGCRHVLDVACGNGSAALRFLQDHPELRVVGVDYSPRNIATAQAAAEALGLADRASFHALPVYDYATHTATDAFHEWVTGHAPFDGVFIGEFLEHCVGTADLLTAIERGCAPGARVVATMPHGPFIDLLPRGHEIHRGHVHHFEGDDLAALFGAKTGYECRYLHQGCTRRGDAIGTWVVTWLVDVPAVPVGERDLVARGYVTRPFTRLSVGLITYNAANDLRRCLESVWGIADELVVGDTGSTDETVAIAESFGATVLHLPKVLDLPGGFGEARNRVLAACTGDWFLWIDSDEVLHHPERLRRYLETGPFRGYALRQQHLMLDAPLTFDTPVRLFKRAPGIQFFGCVHEQPQDGDANTDIVPALQLHDVSLLHYGYPTEDVRRSKANRNFPLLRRNHEVFPERRLNKVLDVREAVLRANDLCQQAGGVTPEAQALYEAAVLHFEAEFADPTDKYHGLARPFYEQALESLEAGWQYEVAFAGTQGSLNGRKADVKRYRVRRYEDIERLVLAEVQAAKKAMHPPLVNTTPLASPTEVLT